MDIEFYNYKRLLKGDTSRNIFKTPWGSVLIRNYDRNKRQLIKYDSFDNFKKSLIPVFILCTLKIFREHRHVFPIYVCSECKKMRSVETLGMKQEESRLKKFKCIHSRIVENIVQEEYGDWRTVWPISLSNILNVRHHEVKVNASTVSETLLEDNEFLAVIKNKSKITSILHTVTTHMRVPWCTSCRRKFCKCFYLYKETRRQEHQQLWPNGGQVKILHMELN